LHNLVCPLDNLALEQKGRSLVCSNNHSFDLAKTGYVNLLPVQQKHSKDPGDSKEMVIARHNFLNTHTYEPIANAINTHIKHLLFQRMEPSFSLLDAGCGEGYYLSYLQQFYGKKLKNSIGLDVSKWAVMEASKRNKNLGWLVGSNASLPMPASRFDGVLCLFGFPVWSEFHRVLADDGFIILANAGAKHLLELREILYPEIRPYTPINYESIDGVVLEQESTITFQFEIESTKGITELLSMTPHRYKASYEGRKKLEQVQKLVLTADVTLSCLRKVDIKGLHNV